ncbi:HPr family phosphocarrier protein [Blautia hansenii]|uniref:HPr domain-containing protein n=1 Tax=Blautia hansenii DSM 20583 TaxID=537007 RepID=C9L7Z7_BLAHA|nr:HPr family phosphocarrier protein [Blautia hansenii]ASM69705.1 HPr family phosphocarrier protein [Blautia hansenii DSM 20583]EEX21892.1 hypothetical protein BLAHAN_05520 [Blautia hansenii DSM 20583]UWO09452.1 HPr family phosphocarrier protein [Blautia hansenii DSM 20583]
METKIQLNYISDMNAFVNACSTVFEEEIYVKQGRQVINAKSLLGMYSLDWSKPVTVEIVTDNENVKDNFYKYVKEWEVQEND